jgi:hypothetical protein
MDKITSRLKYIQEIGVPMPEWDPPEGEHLDDEDFVHYVKPEKEKEMNDLYQTKTEPKEYGTLLAKNSAGRLVLEIRGTTIVKDFAPDEVEIVRLGPQLQIAKSLVDECLNEWSADSRPEIRAIVTRAFNTDKAGQINRAEIFMLLRLEIEDERWNKAMLAIRDAIRVVGSKTYIRYYRRATIEQAFEPISIDMAKA